MSTRSSNGPRSEIASDNASGKSNGLERVHESGNMMRLQIMQKDLNETLARVNRLKLDTQSPAPQAPKMDTGSSLIAPAAVIDTGPRSGINKRQLTETLTKAPPSLTVDFNNVNVGALMQQISSGEFGQIKLLTLTGLGKGDVSREIDHANAINPTNIPLLETLTINESDLISDQLVVLYDAIAKLPVLNTLTIRACTINLSSMTAFLNTIKYSRLASLSTLNLDNNNIGDEIMIVFSNAVPKLVSLRRLDLSHNSIGDDGITEFSKVLEGGALDKLKVLNIDNNNIGDHGLIEFAKAIASGKPANLKSLSLNQQTVSKEIYPISNKGMIKFADALAKRKKVTHGPISIQQICVDDGPTV
jgi:hypothetical protein